MEGMVSRSTTACRGKLDAIPQRQSDMRAPGDRWQGSRPGYHAREGPGPRGTVRDLASSTEARPPTRRSRGSSFRWESGGNAFNPDPAFPRRAPCFTDPCPGALIRPLRIEPIAAPLKSVTRGWDRRRGQAGWFKLSTWARDPSPAPLGLAERKSRGPARGWLSAVEGAEPELPETLGPSLATAPACLSLRCQVSPLDAPTGCASTTRCRAGWR